MKLTTKNIEVSTNESGEIVAIGYKGKQMLHDGINYWQKIYPVVWPVIGFSRGFVVNGKNYEMPKHGFWKTMKWDSIFEGESISMLTTYNASEIYPFTIDIEQNIKIIDDSVVIKTKFSNLSTETAYFHFGHHPAFKIDKDSYLITNATPYEIDTQGKLTDKLIPNKPFMSQKFGVDFDTVVFKDSLIHELSFNYDKVNVHFEFGDFENVQAWKPKDADFICIEPWQGYNDDWYKAPTEAKEKIGVITLPTGETVEKTLTISFNDVK